MLYLRNLFIIVLTGYSLTSKDSFNPNTCAWGSLKASEPTKPEDCLSDQSDSNMICCYMEYFNILTSSTKKACSKQIAKSIINADATFAAVSASLLTDALKLKTFTCKSNSTVDANSNNFYTPNSCAWESLKDKQPTKEEDCYADNSYNEYSCCYLEYSLAGKSIKGCIRQSPKIYSSSADIIKNNLKNGMSNINATVINFNCKVNSSVTLFLTYFILIILSIVV